MKYTFTTGVHTMKAEIILDGSSVVCGESAARDIDARLADSPAWMLCYRRENDDNLLGREAAIYKQTYHDGASGEPFYCTVVYGPYGL